MKQYRCTQHKKHGSLHSLTKREIRICDIEHVKEELAHLPWLLQKNGYELRDISKAFKKEKNPIAKNQDENVKR